VLAGDLQFPGYGDLVFDQTGNIYGTAIGAGSGYGYAFELTPSGGKWMETTIYTFGNGDAPAYPYSGVIFDNAGNLYGTSLEGGTKIGSYGTVYELMPSGPPWAENTLYSFGGGDDGRYPKGGVIFDSSGNLYGATDDGVVFELSPGAPWNYKALYTFVCPCSAEGGPWASLVMDASGNLYGTAYSDGNPSKNYGYGSVFKLTPQLDGTWTYNSLHDFCAGGRPCSDGAYPISTVVMDANGNLYGTTTYGGTGSNCYPGNNGCGVVWEITP